MTDIYLKVKRAIHVQAHILFGQKKKKNNQNNTQTQSKDVENNKQNGKKRKINE